MEAIEHQQCSRQVLFDGPDVSGTHIATCALDARALAGAHHFVEKAVDGIARLAFADPYDAVRVEVVDDGEVAVSFLVGDLVDSQVFEAAQPVPVAVASDAAVEHFGEGGGGKAELDGGLLLGHDLAESHYQEVEAQGAAAVRRGPRDVFLDAPVGLADDLARAVGDGGGEAADGDVTPCPGGAGRPFGVTLDELAAPPALGAARAVLVGLDCEPEHALSGEQLVCGDPKVLEIEEPAQ